MKKFVTFMFGILLMFISGTALNVYGADYWVKSGNPSKDYHFVVDDVTLDHICYGDITVDSSTQTIVQHGGGHLYSDGNPATSFIPFIPGPGPHYVCQIENLLSNGYGMSPRAWKHWQILTYFNPIEFKTKKDVWDCIRGILSNDQGTFDYSATSQDYNYRVAGIRRNNGRWCNGVRLHFRWDSGRRTPAGTLGAFVITSFYPVL